MDWRNTPSREVIAPTQTTTTDTHGGDATTVNTHGGDIGGNVDASHHDDNSAHIDNSVHDSHNDNSVHTDNSVHQQVDTQQATVDQLTAQIKGDQAAIENAQTQLSYTTIKAPLSGRTGFRLIDPPDWAGGSPARVTPADLEDYVYHVVRHATGTIAYVEVFNEMNLPLEWGTSPVDPAAYARILAGAPPPSTAGSWVPPSSTWISPRACPKRANAPGSAC